MRFLKESGFFNPRTLPEYSPILAGEVLLLLLTGLFSKITDHAVFFWIAAVLMGLIVMTIWFFRDPVRIIPGEMNIAVAPADGKIVRIEKSVFDRECQQQMSRIAIFLRLWDVHINRYPVSGWVEKCNYKPGRYYPAMVRKASEFNEQSMIVLKTDQGRFKIRQVAGILARRIVCHAVEGEKAQIGRHFGLIKFGSLVEISMPVQYCIQVNEGQKVISGETIIGKLERK